MCVCSLFFNPHLERPVLHPDPEAFHFSNSLFDKAIATISFYPPALVIHYILPRDRLLGGPTVTESHRVNQQIMKTDLSGPVIYSTINGRALKPMKRHKPPLPPNQPLAQFSWCFFFIVRTSHRRES